MFPKSWLKRFSRWKRRRKNRSLQFEISILYTVILGIILIAFSGVFYLILARTLYQELDNELKLKASEIGVNIQSYVKRHAEDPNALNYAVEKTIASEGKQLHRWWNIGFDRSWLQRLDKQDLSRDYVQFLRTDGEVLASSENVDEDLRSIMIADYTTLNEGYYRDLSFNEARLRAINFPFRSSKGVDYIIQVAISPKPVVQLLARWMTSIFLIIPLILLLTSFIGYMLSRRILKPVEQITDAAQNISHDDLSLRVPRSDYKETNRLIGAFNHMIARLDRSFGHIENFSSYVAHELKTPLTIIKGESELALMEKRSIKKVHEAVQANMEEADKMTKIVEDLLLLTRMDFKTDVFDMQEVDLNRFLEEIVEQTKPVRAEKDIEIDYQPAPHQVSVNIDAVHMRRLFFNLIDNAIKFSPENTTISIIVKSVGNSVLVRVKDQGPGIEPAALEKIFDRFYRVQSTQKGSGLGLNIAQAIAHMHHGRITVKSRLGHGTTFTVELPLYATTYLS